MKLYLNLYVFIFFIPNIVKGISRIQCVKNILGECVRPLVPARFKMLQSGVGVDNIALQNNTALRAGSQDKDGYIENESVNYFKTQTWEVFCKMQPNGWNCGEKGSIYVYYFDLKLLGCKTAEIGEACPHNYNQFRTLKDCYSICRDDGGHSIATLQNMAPHVFCRLQPDFGDCDGYFPSFYFDLTYRQCRGFSYSGCGGNANRFDTSLHCAAVCAPVVDYEPVFT